MTDACTAVPVGAVLLAVDDDNDGDDDVVVMGGTSNAGTDAAVHSP